MSTLETTTTRNRIPNFSFALRIQRQLQSRSHDQRAVAWTCCDCLRRASGFTCIATELAQRGASVAVVHHGQPHPAETLCEVMQSFGSKAMALEADITNEVGCANMLPMSSIISGSRYSRSFADFRH